MQQGEIGRGIAERALQGGHDLVVYNRTPEKDWVVMALEQARRMWGCVRSSCGKPSATIRPSSSA